MKKLLLTTVLCFSAAGVAYAGYSLPKNMNSQTVTSPESLDNDCKAWVYDTETGNGIAVRCNGFANGTTVYGDTTEESQVVELPDGGTATGATTTVFVTDSGPTGDNTITIDVPDGDNSTFMGVIIATNETDGTLFSSAATLSATDTITLSSANTEPGDYVSITSVSAGFYLVSGSIRFESIGQDTVLYSSAVASTD